MVAEKMGGELYGRRLLGEVRAGAFCRRATVDATLGIYWFLIVDGR